MHDPQVLILGAGVARLAAAWKLAASGLSSIVLEARDRVGGRIHTLRPGNASGFVEAGPEFVHGHGTKLEKLIWDRKFEQ